MFGALFIFHSTSFSCANSMGCRLFLPGKLDTAKLLLQDMVKCGLCLTRRNIPLKTFSNQNFNVCIRLGRYELYNKTKPLDYRCRIDWVYYSPSYRYC